MSEDISSHLLVEKKGRIAYVTLNRPERLNALTQAHWKQLADAWRELDDDPDVLGNHHHGVWGAGFLYGPGPQGCGGHGP